LPAGALLEELEELELCEDAAAGVGRVITVPVCCGR